MSITMKSLGIDQLSVTERILLVEEIWDSIVATPEQVPLTETQRAELDERLAKYEADPEAGATWEEVKVRLWGQP
jgi:putative addiction module component (TIGR02574 family)